MGEEAHELELVDCENTGRLKSLVWKHFGFKKREDGAGGQIKGDLQNLFKSLHQQR
jgi:hypothetical protein